MPINHDELEALLDRYWPVLVAWVGGKRDGAEDWVQSAFIKLAAEEPQPENCVAWLFTVTKRLAVNDQVAQAKRRTREKQAVERSPRSADLSHDFELRDLLDQLDAREREIVIAKIWGGLTFDEISSLDGEPKASLWRTYRSGLAKLRHIYGKAEHESSP